MMRNLFLFCMYFTLLFYSPDQAFAGRVNYIILDKTENSCTEQKIGNLKSEVATFLGMVFEGAIFADLRFSDGERVLMPAWEAGLNLLVKNSAVSVSYQDDQGWDAEGDGACVQITRLRSITPQSTNVAVIPDASGKLSDTEYEIFLKTSPAFAEAEAKLKSVWSAAKKNLPEAEFSDLRKDQNGWISQNRDSIATHLIQTQGMTRPEAYAHATKERTKQIEDIIKPQRRILIKKDESRVMEAQANKISQKEIPPIKTRPFPDFELVKKNAAQGDAHALYQLGELYRSGIGTKVDLTAACEQYKHAADAGDANGKFRLGLCYSWGDGIKKDIEKAAALFKEATPELQDLAQQGDLWALTNIGLGHMGGQELLKKNDTIAVQYFHKAADAGDPTAQNNLAFMYERGRGTKEDARLAAAYYQAATDQGYAEAAWHLAMGYGSERGIVPQDKQKSLMLYQKAADQGYPQAMQALGNMYLYGKDMPQDFQKALGLLQRAAAQGDANAMLFLGIMHENGMGVAKDEDKAMELYQKSIDAEGNSDADYQLARLMKKRAGWDCSEFRLVNSQDDSPGKYMMTFIVPKGEPVTKVVFDDEFNIPSMQTKRWDRAYYNLAELGDKNLMVLYKLNRIPSKIAIIGSSGKMCSVSQDRSY